jgi:hypothetical protein
MVLLLQHLQRRFLAQETSFFAKEIVERKTKARKARIIMALCEVSIARA